VRVCGFIIHPLPKRCATNPIIKGPGNCTIILASKTSPTAVRGQFYGIAAAVGKIGAFIGTWGKLLLHR